MHCSSCASFSSVKDPMFDEEESDHMRLRKLLQEKILKIERENLEAVQKELLENSKKPEIHGEPKSKHTVKSLINRKIKPKNFKEPRNLCLLSPDSKKFSENADQQQNCCSGNFNNEHSKIHFLNHFQSSLNAYKLMKQRFKAQAEHLPSVPLHQKDHLPVPITVEKLQPSIKKTIKIANTARHRITSADTKNLTVQVLPSISILGNKPKSTTNVSLEEIMEENVANGDAVAKQSYSRQSSNIATYFDSPQHSSEVLLTREFNEQQHSGRSIFPKTNNHLQSEAIVSSKSQLKSLVKEILYDLHISPIIKQQFDNIKESFRSVEESSLETHLKKQENEIQHYNCCHYNKETKTVDTQTSMKCSNYTQTDDLKPLTAETADIRSVVQEAISEYQDFFSSMLEEKYKLVCEKNTEGHQKVDKEIQAVLMEIDVLTVHESKEIQTSFTEEEFHKNQSINPTFQDLSPVAAKVEQSPENLEVMKQMSQLTFKLDNVMNTLNDHLCKTNDNAVRNVDWNISSPSNATRDVSLQFSPQMMHRGTCTSLQKFADVGNQCDLQAAFHKKLCFVDALTQTSSDERFQFKEVSKVVRTFEAFTQSEIPVNAVVDSYTQSESPVNAVIDSCTQTKEYASSLQGSDHSNSTSTTSTPVNDSLFVDDSFSEGELPWHLRFLSGQYKNDRLSCNKLADSTVLSEGQDYSSSEGEIHQQYTDQKCDKYSSAAHSIRGDPVEFNSQIFDSPLSNSENLLNPCTHMKASYSHIIPSSSLSDGREEKSLTLLSSGEIRPSWNHFSTQHQSSKAVTSEKFFNYKKNVPIKPTGSSHMSSNSCYNHPKTRDAAVKSNFSNAHSIEKSIPSASKEERNNTQIVNKKFPAVAFCEKHGKSQSPINWSSLSSLELSNSETQESS